MSAPTRVSRASNRPGAARAAPGRASVETLRSDNGVSSRAGRRVATTWACLVVSEDDRRRRGFVEAAERAGWTAIPCGSVGEAIQQANRWRTQLRVLDLGDMAAVQKSAYLKFAGTITSREALLVVGDEPTTELPDAELLARQAGAWVYLATPQFDEGLAELMANARDLAEKIGGNSTPSPAKVS